MSEHQAQRTLVKSPPELWAEVSDADSLGRRLEALGEVSITRAEPESTVAWEGENVSGTVTLEPSGWGTKVRIEATLEEPAAVEEPEPEPVAEPETETETEEQAVPEPAAAPTPSIGFFARLFSSAKPDPAPGPEPEAVKPPEVEPTVTAEEPPAEAEPAGEAEEPALDAETLEAVLEAALDSLGAAHHRPFSRS